MDLGNSSLDGDQDVEWSAEKLARSSYKDLGNNEQIEQRFSKLLLASSSCRSSLENLLAGKESFVTRDYSLEIDVFDLLQGDPVLGHLLLRYPTPLMERLENAIVESQRKLNTEKQQGEGKDELRVKGEKKTRVHARLIHLPPSCCKLALGSLQASDVGKIVQVSGTVVRTTPVCMYESRNTYKCVGKNGCGLFFHVEADLGQRHNALVAPERCMASQQCKGKSFTKSSDATIRTDYQEVTIQESASQLGGAHVPRSLLIKLQHDLCDKCQPGDEVIVVGLLLAHWHQSAVPNADCQVGLTLRATSIRVIQDKSTSAWTSGNSATADGRSVGTDMDEDKFRNEFKKYWEEQCNKDSPIAARDYICKAVCPKLYGMQVIKLALLITLIGGSGRYEPEKDGSDPNAIQDDNVNNEPEQFQFAGQQFTNNTNRQSKNSGGDGKSVQTRRRGQSHLLLVGDPGTGKSQFLRFAAAICPRSVLTTGVGTTSAGLTCAAVRENGKEFSLEAGALVLADQGVCCIDEFGCIQNEDRCTIHEAMEQQTLSVAKAGIVCKLNCRATIIAVMNPRDCTYDNQQSLSRNTGLGTVSLVDSSDSNRDDNVTKYLLNRAILQGCDPQDHQSTDDNSLDTRTPWTMDKLRAYISYVREKFQPEMTDEAATLLERHYEKLRSAQSYTIPVTVRCLESLIRLSQAHARLMCHETVDLDDAVAVIRIMECTAFAYGGFDDLDYRLNHTTNNTVELNYNDILYQDPMEIDFLSAKEADSDFEDFKERVLSRYGMQNLMRRRKQLAHPPRDDYCDDAAGQQCSACPTHDGDGDGEGEGRRQCNNQNQSGSWEEDPYGTGNKRQRKG